jgi:hypothetical protein
VCVDQKSINRTNGLVKYVARSDELLWGVGMQRIYWVLTENEILDGVGK